MLGTVIRYDTALEKYNTTAIAPMFVPLHRFGAAVLDGKIYVIGGKALGVHASSVIDTRFEPPFLDVNGIL